MIGRTISHYEITGKLGEGGMGVVYKARDTRLDRSVALKLLPPDKVADPARRRRFVQEARAASALNHPHIVTIHDIEEVDGVYLIAMESVEGTSLDACIPPGGLPVPRAVKYATEMASAMAAAHAAGIVNRDLKPANIMLDVQDEVKVLDFGLAKLTEAPTAAAGADTGLPTETMAGTIAGTPAYMSPEQAAGRVVDARSDVFSFGVVLYEMLTGVSVFRRDSTAASLAAVLLAAPPALKASKKGIPAGLARIVSRCLEKNPDARYPSAIELHRELLAIRSDIERRAAGFRGLARNPYALTAGAVALVAIVAAGVWLGVQARQVRWARNVALPEVARLIEAGKVDDAFRLVRRAERTIPGDAELLRLRAQCAVPASVATEPAGADVFWKSYASPDDAWEPLGRSPLKSPLVPARYLRWKIVKQGFEPVELAAFGSAKLSVPLSPKGESPEMTRIPAGAFAFLPMVSIRLGEYRLDRREVTNREYKAFVDAGGYRKREFWKQPFVDGGRTLAWEEAIARFRDTTGRPGPATWEMDSCPAGQEDYPVGGVSWYEAAAYAEFAGKSLPTIYHWRRAAGVSNFEIIGFSNFSGRGPAKAGSHQGMSPFGNLDMAGNLKEWCWNGSSGSRFLLGASWSEPAYWFSELDARSPFERSPAFGFRCAKYSDAVAPGLLADYAIKRRDYTREKPASDEVYRAYSMLYAYDRTPLDPVVETKDDKVEYWRREKITLKAAYRGETFPVYLFLPRNAKPPYQTVVYFPGTHAFMESGPSDAVSPLGNLERTAYLIRSGRALVAPVYFAMYERRKGPFVRPAATSIAMRDVYVNDYKDLARTLDYLETRSDIDRSRLAYYGVSSGGVLGSVFTAQDPRFRTAVFVSGAFWYEPYPPEVDPLNFASHSRTPVLMLNGRYDFAFTVEGCQRPLFRALGVAEKDKRHVLFDSGHDIPAAPMMKDVLEWLDRYLGPVPPGS